MIERETMFGSAQMTDKEARQMAKEIMDEIRLASGDVLPKGYEQSSFEKKMKKIELYNKGDSTVKEKPRGTVCVPIPSREEANG